MKYFVCNLKNKLNKDEIVKYNNNLKKMDTNSHLIIAPSYPFLSCFERTNYKLASQDISSFMEKTLTGEVTGEQLKSLDVSYVIIGHSERRILKKEINIDFINKINNANSNGIKVIYCIGEDLKQREGKETFKVLEKQISEVLNNVELKNIIIAYEPVWAIGTGVVPNNKVIEETIEYIKDIVDEKYGIKLPVLYGGSINEENIDELNEIKNVDGFLIGGASLDTKRVQKMLEIVGK